MSTDSLETLREFAERWNDVVMQVECGYAFSFDDYLNDIDLRRIIDERIRAVAETSADVPEQLRTIVDSADARFRDATFETRGNIWGDLVEQDEDWNANREWYYYRLPIERRDWLEFLENS